MRLFKRILERVLVIMAWIQVTILFGLSLWSVKGEYGMALLALIIMLFLLIDDVKKYGIKNIFSMQEHVLLGSNYYLYRVVTLVISCIVNILVWVNLYLQRS